MEYAEAEAPPENRLCCRRLPLPLKMLLLERSPKGLLLKPGVLSRSDADAGVLAPVFCCCRPGADTAYAISKNPNPEDQK